MLIIFLGSRPHALSILLQLGLCQELGKCPRCCFHNSWFSHDMPSFFWKSCFMSWKVRVLVSLKKSWFFEMSCQKLKLLEKKKRERLVGWLHSKDSGSLRVGTYKPQQNRISVRYYLLEYQSHFILQIMCGSSLTGSQWESLLCLLDPLFQTFMSCPVSVWNIPLSSPHNKKMRGLV